MLVILPLIMVRFLWRSLKAPAYRQRLLERVAVFKNPERSPCIWIHAVSLGEFIAAIPLIKSCLQTWPDRQIVVTTTTPTGSGRVLSNFGQQVFHVYVPLDLKFAVVRFLKKVRPTIAIFMETELWPNLLGECAERKIPVILANARLAPRSFAGYKRIKPLTTEMMRSLSYVCAQSAMDAQRFLDLGLPKERLMVMGNIKFDISVKPETIEQGRQLKHSWGETRLVWMAASTHEGEEIEVIKAHLELLRHYPNALLLLVPRHPERFNRVAELIEDQGFSMVRHSRKQMANEGTQVYLGDTLGEMNTFFAATDVVFMGGSLIPVGGHNLLEPAAQGLPSVTGPQLFNFVAVSEMLNEAKAIMIISEADELASKILQLFADAALRKQMGDAGRMVVEENRGALERLMKVVTPLLATAPPPSTN